MARAWQCGGLQAMDQQRGVTTEQLRNQLSIRITARAHGRHAFSQVEMGGARLSSSLRRKYLGKQFRQWAADRA